MADATDTAPRFLCEEFPRPNLVQSWLNSHPEYDLVTALPISVTNHFSKETETTVWVIAEMRPEPA